MTADGVEKFATYLRDGTGQDYAEQRYYNSGTGRFWSPDPGGMATADAKNPLSWNLYSYVTGDPVNFIDPGGTDELMAAVGDSKYGTGLGECNLDGMDVSCSLISPDGVAAYDGPTLVPNGGGGTVIGFDPNGDQYLQFLGSTTTGAATSIVGIIIDDVQRGAGISLGAVFVLVGVLLNPKSTAGDDGLPPARKWAVPAPFNPLEVVTDPNGGWAWNENQQKYWKDCPPGSKRTVQTLHQDPDHVYKGSHWDYVDCDGKSWTIWPDGTMTPAKG